MFEQLSRECFRSFASLPNASLIDRDGVFGVINDIPLTFFNGIASASDPDCVGEVVEIFRARGRAFRWWPTSPDLEPALEAHGLRHAYDSTGMIADLTRVTFDTTHDIVRVSDERALRAWAEVLTTVFHVPAALEAWVAGLGHFGFGEASPWVHFAALVDGAPVATASVLLCGEMAGIYLVGTLPHARSRGLGAAVTGAALRHAQERGATQAALQSSEMAVNVYRSLGFVAHETLRLYEWAPGPSMPD